MKLKSLTLTISFLFYYIYAMEINPSVKGVYIISLNKGLSSDDKTSLENRNIHIIKKISEDPFDYLVRIKNNDAMQQILGAEYFVGIQPYDMEKHSYIDLQIPSDRDFTHMQITIFEEQDTCLLIDLFIKNNIKFQHFGKRCFLLKIYEKDLLIMPEFVNELKNMTEVASIQSEQLITVYF
jgi:hypothetical protein